MPSLLANGEECAGLACGCGEVSYRFSRATLGFARILDLARAPGHIDLLLVFSKHAFFLSGCRVETREFSGAGQLPLIPSN